LFLFFFFGFGFIFIFCSGFFDDPLHSTGGLTARLALDAESINNVVALSSGLNIQNLTTLVSGIIIAFVYGWELALVRIQ
jgi:ATP-binding cassette subfamily B (MDR/TAP) protein 1